MCWEDKFLRAGVQDVYCLTVANPEGKWRIYFHLIQMFVYLHSFCIIHVCNCKHLHDEFPLQHRFHIFLRKCRWMRKKREDGKVKCIHSWLESEGMLSSSVKRPLKLTLCPGVTCLWNKSTSSAQRANTCSVADLNMSSMTWESKWVHCNTRKWKKISVSPC